MSGINTMDYVRGVEQASGIYAQALHEYSIDNAKLERKVRELRGIIDHLLRCNGCECVRCQREYGECDVYRRASEERRKADG